MTIKLKEIVVSVFYGGFVFFLALQAPGSSFKDRQLANPRVRAAFQEKEAALQELFTRRQLPFPASRIFIRVFKKEKQVEVWVQPQAGGRYTLLNTYEICWVPGALGPKRRVGDNQVPEGFYFVDRFNPQSQFYLSLGINYPNASDRILGKAGHLGGDIFIHGNCVTIGCIPITDDKIKELYLLAVLAKANGQEQIPVHIFPARMDEAGWQQLQTEFKNNPGLLAFWQNLKQGYDRFEQSGQIPQTTVDAEGRYLFSP